MVFCLPDSWQNWTLEMLVFEERGKPEYPEKNLLEQRREPTTNSTHIWRRRRDLNPGHIGGRRVLSPLRHPRSGSLSELSSFFVFNEESESRSLQSLQYKSSAVRKVRKIKKLKRPIRMKLLESRKPLRVVVLLRI